MNTGQNKLDGSANAAKPTGDRPQSDSQVMDLDVALGRMMGNRLLLTQLAQFFLDDAPVLLAEIDAGRRTNDTGAVRRAAHSLKSLAANFEALPAVAAAKLVEVQCLDNDVVRWEQSVPALHVEIERLSAELARLTAQDGGSPSQPAEPS